jgi:hypothetical protein
MRLTVKNLGPISNASVDLSRDLIVLTGENNTGKSYLAYLVASSFTPFRMWFGKQKVWSFRIGNEFKFDSSGKLKLDLSQSLDKILAENIQSGLSFFYAYPLDFFDKTEIKVSFFNNSKYEKLLKVKQLNQTRHQNVSFQGTIVCETLSA